jgi:phosphonatase-like hydrolase
MVERIAMSLSQSMIQLVVFDMAGTTVDDQSVVKDCFLAAADKTGLVAPIERVVGMMGWAKQKVFATLWADQLGVDHPDYLNRVQQSYEQFQAILDEHYRTQPVRPTEGCLETFSWLKSVGIKIALTTGFYREVTNIILHRLGWDEGLDQTYIGSDASLIQASITPSEIYGNEGRPAPFMIQKAMYRLGVTDPQRVVAIGDTPADLAAGMNANCWSLGVTTGSHTRSQLLEYPHHGLLDSLRDLKEMMINP